MQDIVLLVETKHELNGKLKSDDVRKTFTETYYHIQGQLSNRI